MIIPLVFPFQCNLLGGDGVKGRGLQELWKWNPNLGLNIAFWVQHKMFFLLLSRHFFETVPHLFHVDTETRDMDRQRESCTHFHSSLSLHLLLLQHQVKYVPNVLLFVPFGGKQVEKKGERKFLWVRHHFKTCPFLPSFLWLKGGWGSILNFVSSNVQSSCCCYWFFTGHYFFLVFLIFFFEERMRR